MAEFDPNLWYEFKNPDGTTEWYKGDNNFVRQAVEGGVPITCDDKGNWHILPYVDRDTNGGITFHIPHWFEETEEYNEFTTIHEPYFLQQPQTNELMEQANKVLERLGKSAYEKKKEEHMASQDLTSQDEPSPTEVATKDTSSIDTSVIPEQFQNFSFNNVDVTGVAIGLMMIIAIAGIVCIVRDGKNIH